jgi:hypothetical protein
MRTGFIILGCCFIVAMVLLLDQWGWSNCHVNWSDVSGFHGPVKADVSGRP